MADYMILLFYLIASHFNSRTAKWLLAYRVLLWSHLSKAFSPEIKFYQNGFKSAHCPLLFHPMLIQPKLPTSWSGETLFMSKFPPVLITSLRLSFPIYLVAHSSWIISKLNTLFFSSLGRLISFDKSCPVVRCKCMLFLFSCHCWIAESKEEYYIFLYFFLLALEAHCICDVTSEGWIRPRNWRTLRTQTVIYCQFQGGLYLKHSLLFTISETVIYFYSFIF